MNIVGRKLFSCCLIEGMPVTLCILLWIFFMYFGFVFFYACGGGKYSGANLFREKSKGTDALEGSISEEASCLDAKNPLENSDNCKTEFKKGFGRVVVVGAGPVGSFISVLAGYLGIPVTCYEKREAFTRKIKLKITNNFFDEVQQTLDNLGVCSSFFREMNRRLHSHDNKIVISELEQMLCSEARSTGKLEYKTEEIRSFSEVYKRHKKDNPVILDCTGRNSKLRIDEFGDDSENVVTTPLQHAIYINIRTKYKKPVNLYSAMKNIKDVLLTNITVGGYREIDTFTNVTIPVFISENLAGVFDSHCPNTNKRPFNPFDASCNLPDSIFYPISSIIGCLVLEEWVVDFRSVEVKKIEISCGYAIKRSRGWYVCLGDSAVHLAFFRSLNLGLKNALEFFVSLSTYCREPRAVLSERWIMEQFTQNKRHLAPIRVYKTERRNSYMIVTKLLYYGCFHYCLTDRRTERLTSIWGIYKAQVKDTLSELNARLCNWNSTLWEFESRRKNDIKDEVRSNLEKNDMYNYMSWVINVNGSSPIKLSETISMFRRGYFLSRESYSFFLKCFKVLMHANASNISTDDASRVIWDIMNKYMALHRNRSSIFASEIWALKDVTSSIIYGREFNRDKDFVKCMAVIRENGNTSAMNKLELVNKVIESEKYPTRCTKLCFVKNLIYNIIINCEQSSD